MHGLRSIQNINTQHAIGELGALKLKAIEARRQNHPKADEIEEQARKMEESVAPGLAAKGYNA
jgi:hypothetical protein